MRQPQQEGFTIVELLIAIVVIAILAGISVVAYSGVRERAQQSAREHSLSQVERQISTHAAANGDSVSISGTLVGHIEGAGVEDLLHPLARTPDITMYVAYDVLSTAGNYQGISRLTPSSVNPGNVFMLRTDSSSSNLGVRVDSPAQSNVTMPRGEVRVAGNTSVGWLITSNDATRLASNWNSAVEGSARSLNPGSGWRFEGIETENNSGEVRAALVFEDAHDERTRAQVISWLQEEYDFSLQ